MFVNTAKLCNNSHLASKCDACLEDNTTHKACNCDGKIQDFNTNHADANSSFAHAVLNMIGMLIGLGQLSTPYAIAKGGWVSSFLLIGLGIICGYTCDLLGKCLHKNPNARSYPDIGQQAFGHKGRVLASTLIWLEIFMALVSYTISLHDNIIIVFSGTNLSLPWTHMFSKSQLLTIIAVLVALPSLWLRNLSSISLLSSAGILMSLVIFICVAFTAVFGIVKPNHHIPPLNMQKIPSISGLYMFSYAGHIVFPNLYKSMKDPSNFTKVCIVSFASVTTLYSALGLTGAKMFGSNVSSQITLSMPPHLVITKIALWATVLTPITKYALEFAPFAIQLEHKLPKSLTPNIKMLIRATVGSLLLLVILILALSVPYFEHVLGLTGSLVSACICIVFPCAFYTKISWPQISKSLLFLNISLIAFGSVLGIVGTVSTSRSLLRNLIRAHSK